MGVLDRILHRQQPDLALNPRRRMVSGESVPSTAQERLNRSLMEAEMDASRARREAERNS